MARKQPVALKVCKELLDATNASLIMAEVELLRKLEHPHIVKFYGTSLLKKDGTIRVMLVMEKCKENLKSHIFGHPESALQSLLFSLNKYVGGRKRSLLLWCSYINRELSIGISS
ncbi:Serine/threonine-protein kinase sik2 [Desmophyllum pertusum]|uniref:Serine/threonine-protein kinase sik2 n=1 Tax=Desmophyllum pertusum TaxID=174260 RepID=A0A9X0D9Y4_9CNID|nr:Serine/threonine-protein kinase sik2 [Desmophyllum pertusum]